MKRILTAVIALGLVAAVLVLPTSAWAWGRGRHFVGGFAVGAITGLALGAAFAPVYAYPAPVYAYPAPVYVAPPPAPVPLPRRYYCRSARPYCPSVPRRREPWLPRPAQRE